MLSGALWAVLHTLCSACLCNREKHEGTDVGSIISYNDANRFCSSLWGQTIKKRSYNVVMEKTSTVRCKASCEKPAESCYENYIYKMGRLKL